MKRDVVFWSIVISVFLFDRVTKLVVLNVIPLYESVSVLPFLSFTHVLNTGTVFGLFKQAGWFFIVFAGAASAYIIYAYRKYDRVMQVLLALVLAGALGNLVDRLWYGAVIDFVDVHVWPVFNIADSAISIAVAVLLVREFLPRTGRRIQRKV